MPPLDLGSAVVAAHGRNGVLRDGAIALATLWESAWHAANGEETTDAEVAAIARTRLRKLYEDPAFVASLYLNDIAGSLR